MKTTSSKKTELVSRPRSFWEPASLDELIGEQKVEPVNDLSVLYDSWPGELDDGFEEAIDRLRHRDVENRRWH